MPRCQGGCLLLTVNAQRWFVRLPLVEKIPAKAEVTVAQLSEAQAARLLGKIHESAGVIVVQLPPARRARTSKTTAAPKPSRRTKSKA